MNQFSSRLTSLRKSRGFSLETLTTELNKKSPENIKFSRASLNRWEKGEISPSLDHAKIIAKFFGVTLDQLGGIEDIENIEDKHQIETIAAHIDENVTEDEMKEIINYIEFIKSKK